MGCLSLRDPSNLVVFLLVSLANHVKSKKGTLKKTEPYIFSSFPRPLVSFFRSSCHTRNPAQLFRHSGMIRFCNGNTNKRYGFNHGLLGGVGFAFTGESNRSVGLLNVCELDFVHPLPQIAAELRLIS